MKKLLLLTTIFITSLSNSQTWQNLGTTGIVSTSSPDFYTSLTIDLDSNNIPYCCYSNTDNAGQITVKKLTGNTWVSVGSSINTAPNSFSSSLAINNNDVPYVAFLASYPNTGNNGVVKKFDGTNWINVGITGFTTNAVSDVKIEIDNNNIPYISYNANDSGGEKIIVKRFDGSNWISLGTIDNDAWVFYDFQLDNNNTPYVVYNKINNLDVNLYVKKFNGTSWVDVGLNGLVATDGSKPSFEFDSTNNPFVAFISGNNDDLIVKKFNGSSWVNVGNTLAANLVRNQKIAIGPNNMPYVAYKDPLNNNANVKKWNGTSWDLITAPTSFVDNDENLALVVGSNNIPYLSYSTLDNNAVGSIKAKFYGNNLSTSDNEFLNDLKVYPNPSNAVLNIDTSSEISKITITDMLGKTVFETSENLNKIDISNLKTGIYVLKVINTIGEKTIKISKT